MLIRAFYIIFTILLNSFVFTQPSLTKSFLIPEHSPPNTLIGNLFSTFGFNYKTESLQLESVSVEDRWANAFKFDKNTGNLYTSSDSSLKLDREIICPESDDSECFIELIFTLNGAELIFVKVVIDDINDNPPTFPDGMVEEISIPESFSKFDSLSYALKPAKDLDSKNTKIIYRLLSKNQDLDIPFKLKSPDNPILLLRKALDFEEIQEYQLILEACDGPDSCIQKLVIVNVLNVNDHRPEFKQSLYQEEIDEITVIGSNIVHVEATDDDLGNYGRVLYSLIEETDSDIFASNYFIIDQRSGIIRLKQKLPGSKKFMIKIQAEDGYYANYSRLEEPTVHFVAKTVVSIVVRDSNNHKPKISLQNHDLFKEIYASIERDKTGNLLERKILLVPEESETPLTIAYLTVIDKDKGRNAKVECRIVSEDNKNFQNAFALQFANQINEHQTVYKLTAQKRFEAESDRNLLKDSGQLYQKGVVGFYNLQINCTDKGIPALYEIEDLRIGIVDQDEYSKVFMKHPYQITVPEDTEVGTILLPLSVEDSDAASYTVYEMVQENDPYFEVEFLTGKLILKRNLDFETTRFYNISVLARDFRSSVQSPLNAWTYILINVTDVNDNAPNFHYPELSSNEKLNYIENMVVDGVRALQLPENMRLDSRITTVFARDPDSGQNGHVELFIDRVLINSTLDPFKKSIPSKLMFRMDNNGAIFNKVILDREENEVIDIVVGARDRGQRPLTSYTVIRIELVDENDCRPEWMFPKEGDDLIRLNSHHPIQMVITRIKANDPDALGLNSALNYTINNATEPEINLFSLNSTTGEIRLKSNIVKYPIGTLFILPMRVCDKGIPSHCSDSKLRLTITEANPNAFQSLSEDSNNSGRFGEHRMDKRHQYMLTLAGGVLIGLIMTVCIIITLLVFMCKRRSAKKQEKKLIAQSGRFLSQPPGSRFLPPSDTTLLGSKVVMSSSNSPISTNWNENLAILTPSATPQPYYHSQEPGLVYWGENVQSIHDLTKPLNKEIVSYACGTPKLSHLTRQDLEEVTNNSLKRRDFLENSINNFVPQEYIYIPFRNAPHMVGSLRTQNVDYNMTELAELNAVTLNGDFFNGITPIVASTDNLGEDYQLHLQKQN